MVDPEFFAEHAAETIRDLRCQRDFGQQKQDLFSLGDDAPNEFDVDFRLPARRHAVQEHHFLFFPRRENCIVRCLLRFAQGTRRQALHGFVGFEASHLNQGGNEQSAAHQGRNGRCSALGQGLDEFRTAHFCKQSEIIESLGRRYAGSIEESQHRLGLSRRPPQLFQRLLERLHRSVVGSERESRFAFRFEALTHFFFDRDTTRFDQVFERSQQSRTRYSLAQIAHAQRFGHQRPQDFARLLIVRFIVRIRVVGQGKERFALQLQTGGQGGFHHFAGTAHIILRHPAPKSDLLLEQQRSFVDQLLNRLDALFVEIRQLFVQTNDNAGVAFVFAQRHHHTRADDDAPVELCGQSIGVGTGNGEGEHNVCEHGENT